MAESGGWLSSIGDWISKNEKIIKPIVNMGTSALSQINKDKAANSYEEYLKQKEGQSYQTQVDQINAYNVAAQNAAANSSANSAANAAASRATDANRMAASKTANDYNQKTYKEILKMYKPFRQTANQLLPQMTNTYENSLGLQNALAQYVQSPEQMALLNNQTPAYNINVPIPDYARLK